VEQVTPGVANNEVAKKELEGDRHDKPDPADQESESFRFDRGNARENPDIEGKQAEPDDGRQLVSPGLGHPGPEYFLAERPVQNRNDKQATPVGPVYQERPHNRPKATPFDLFKTPCLPAGMGGPFRSAFLTIITSKSRPCNKKSTSVGLGTAFCEEEGKMEVSPTEPGLFPRSSLPGSLPSFPGASKL
jgi:hypothetical protein